jgi:hypothetical protein
MILEHHKWDPNSEIELSTPVDMFSHKAAI